MMNILPVLTLVAAIGDTTLANGGINTTFLLSIITISLAGMATLIKIFGNNTKKEDTPSDANIFCQLKSHDMKKIEESVAINISDTKEIKDIINGLKLTINGLEKDGVSMNKTIEEIKQDNKALVTKLETLLGQLMSYVGD